MLNIIAIIIMIIVIITSIVILIINISIINTIFIIAIIRVAYQYLGTDRNRYSFRKEPVFTRFVEKRY